MIFKRHELNLIVEGMHCQKCVARITDALKKISDVKKVNIDLEKKAVAVISKAQLDLSIVKEAIEALGFKVVE